MKNISKIKGGFAHKVNQSISNERTKELRKKHTYQIIAICIAAVSLTVAIIANWEKSCNIFK